MNITIFTKNGCPNCVTAKRLLQDKGFHDYTELNVEEDLGAGDWLKAKHPEARQMPQIFIEGQRVGGLAGLQQALKQLEGCQCPACKITPHASDCAVHNAPAEPAGACDCGGQA